MEDDELQRSTRRWATVGLVLAIAMVLIFPVYRWYEPVRRADAREALQDDLAAVGKDLYDAQCTTCHGPQGRGGLAAALGSQQFLASVEDNQIEQLVTVGVPGSEMVAYGQDTGGPLTAVQIRSIVAYLRSLETDAFDSPSWRWPMAQEGLSGRELFLMGCARCHGTNLEGTEVAPSLGPGSDAEEDSDSRLARRIREGTDEMPRFGQMLEDEQIEALVAYLREVQADG